MSLSARVSASGFTPLRVLAAGFSFATLLVLALWAARADTQGEIIDPDRFLRKYRDALRNLQTLYEDVNVTGEHKVLPKAKSTNFTYMSSDKKEKLHIWREKPNYFDRVFVSADDRKFEVNRLTRSGSYYLQSISGSVVAWPPSLIDYKIRSQGAAYCPGGVGEFSDFVNSSEFAIRRVSRVSEGNQTLLIVEFEYNPTRNDGIYKLKGWIRVDPQQAFVVRSHDFEFRRALTKGKNAGTERVFRNRGETAYKNENGKPVPSGCHSTLSLNGKAIREDIFTFSKFSLESAPSAEFTLAAFGLGDIERTARQIESRNNYWSAALAMAAILMSLLLFRAGRSLQKRMASAKEIMPPAGPSPEGSTGGQGT